MLKPASRKKRSLAGVDFLWLILQHVLPKGVFAALAISASYTPIASA
jgi:hypothetical protein